MTSDEIDKMEAGTAINKLIHEQVFGLCVHEWRQRVVKSVICEHCGASSSEDEGDYPTKECAKCGATGRGLLYHGNYGLRDYSRNLEEAWMVLEKMDAAGAFFKLEKLHNGEWMASFWKPNVYHIGMSDKTAPLAICRAALRVKGREA